MSGPLSVLPLTDEEFQDTLEHLQVESVMGLHATLRTYLPVTAYLNYPDSHRPAGALNGPSLRLPERPAVYLTWAQQRVVLDHLDLRVPDPEQIRPFLAVFHDRAPDLDEWTDALIGIVRVAEPTMPALARQRITRDAMRSWLGNLERTGSLGRYPYPSAEHLFRKILSH